jgi:hypothetical protein
MSALTAIAAAIITVKRKKVVMAHLLMLVWLFYCFSSHLQMPPACGLMPH